MNELAKMFVFPSVYLVPCLNILQNPMAEVRRMKISHIDDVATFKPNNAITIG